MQATIKTGVFSSEKCEMSVYDDELRLHFGTTTEIIYLSALQSIMVLKQKTGAFKIDFVTLSSKSEVTATDSQNGKETAAFLFDLTKRNGNIRLKITTE